MPPKRKATAAPRKTKVKKARLTNPLLTSIRQADAKYLDTSATLAINTTPNTLHLDIVPTGTLVTTRIGKAWQNTGVHIRGQITARESAVTNHYGIYLVWDRQPNFALASFGTIFDTTSIASSDALPLRSNKQRFRILKSWHGLILGNITAMTNGGEAKLIDSFVVLPKECIAQTTAADTTGVIANRSSGALLLASMGTTAAGAGACGAFFNIRVSVKDV